jgi:hypothetical protein
MNPTSPASLVRDLSRQWGSDLPPSARAEFETLLAELVADWAREADSDADPLGVNAIQRRELEDAVQDRPLAARVAILRALVLGRRISRLRVRTFTLGRAILDGTIAAEAARDDAGGLLREAEVLSARVRALGDPVAAARLMAMLGDALMEALFALEGKAMSPRLARHAHDRAVEP